MSSSYSTIAPAIGRLNKVPLREVWRHEAHDFTAWLADNLDILRDSIGLDLNLVAREHSVGPFFVDIVAEDPAGRMVIIENQLERTDHDHLGKMITYMSNLDARAAIWITSNPRAEHEKAVQWLNEFLPADMHFYLLKIEAVQIGDSPAAPMLTVVAGPSDISAAIGEEKKEMAARHTGRLAFWEVLLEKTKALTQLYNRISPSTDSWISASAGKSGLAYSFATTQNDARVEFVIDAGDRERNKRIFDDLMLKQQEIESRFGAPLVWDRKDERIKSVIYYSIPGGRAGDPEAVSAVQDTMADAMARLESAFKPEIAAIR